MTEIDMSRWSDADRAAYAAAKEALQIAQDVAEADEAQAEAARVSPAALISQMAAERERIERERQMRVWSTQGEAELAKARKKHGADKASLLLTIRGPIVLRAATSKEADILDMRLASLNELDRLKAWRDFTADLVEYPSRDEFLKTMDEFPGTWPIVAAERDALQNAVREEAQKKG